MTHPDTDSGVTYIRDNTLWGALYEKDIDRRHRPICAAA
ncbi:hypothetical protein D3OALGB2SA_2062 [Olavius algarvensis associated proteobacterium Delta 3]|nr:hypothetical protein D3OALGB2SA_2062 [Olavius algarvensis associated proteobacterium Delta 3]